jgi:hypothetical protein
MKNVVDTVVEQFARMVSRDGGDLSLLGVEGDTIRVGYRMGADPDCIDGVCVLPALEVQQLMNETLVRRDPSLRVVVEVID